MDSPSFLRSPRGLLTVLIAIVAYLGLVMFYLKHESYYFPPIEFFNSEVNISGYEPENYQVSTVKDFIDLLMDASQCLGDTTLAWDRKDGKIFLDVSIKYHSPELSGREESKQTFIFQYEYSNEDQPSRVNVYIADTNSEMDTGKVISWLGGIKILDCAYYEERKER